MGLLASKVVEVLKPAAAKGIATLLMLSIGLSVELRADEATPGKIPAAAREKPLTVFDRLNALRQGGRETFQVNLPHVAALDVRVAFDEAPFSGTRLSAKVNGHSLLPYFAFGGDT